MIPGIIIVSMSVMGLVATALVLDKRYEDGLVGRFALVGMILTSFLASMLAFEIWLGDDSLRGLFRVEALVAVFMACAGIFMLRHAYRYARWRFCGEGDWRNKGK